MNWFEIKEENVAKHIKLSLLVSSPNKEDQEIASVLEQKLGLMPICEKTIKVLKFCTPYYEYVGIRTPLPVPYYSDGWGVGFSAYGQPFGIEKRSDWNISQIGDSGDSEGWPAIWKAVNTSGCKSSCGNHHQKQIDKQLTTGLYKNINGIWHKQNS